MHTLVVGQTLSGKTWLCKQLCEILSKAGIPVGVFDPMGCPGDNAWPGASMVVYTKRDFLRSYWASSRCVWIIDEAADNLGESDRPVMTKGRHLGHSNMILSQRAKGMLRPSLRNQCAAALICQQNDDDAAELAAQFIIPEIRTAAPALKQGDCLFALASNSRLDSGNILRPGNPLARRIAKVIIDNHGEPTASFLETIHPGGKVDWKAVIAGGHVSAEDIA